MHDRFVHLWFLCTVLLLGGYAAAGVSLQRRAEVSLRQHASELAAKQAQAEQARQGIDSAASDLDTARSALAAAQLGEALRRHAARLSAEAGQRLVELARQLGSKQSDDLTAWANAQKRAGHDVEEEDVEPARRKIESAWLAEAEVSRQEIARGLEDACDRALRTVPGTLADMLKRLERVAQETESAERGRLASARPVALEDLRQRLLAPGIGAVLVLVVATERLGAVGDLAGQLQELLRSCEGRVRRRAFHLVRRNGSAAWGPGTPLRVAVGEAFECREVKPAFEAALQAREALLGDRGREVTTLLVWPSDFNPNRETTPKGLYVPHKEVVELFWVGAPPGDVDSPFLRNRFHGRVTVVEEGKTDQLSALLARKLPR